MQEEEWFVTQVQKSMQLSKNDPQNEHSRLPSLQCHPTNASLRCTMDLSASVVSWGGDFALLLKKVDAGAVDKPGSCNGCLSFSISLSTATLAEPVLLTHYSTQLRSGSQEHTPITIIIVDDDVGTRGATASKFLVSISTTLFWIHLTILLISILIANKSLIWKRLICIEH